MDAAHYSESPFLAFLGTEIEEWREGYARIGLMPITPISANSLMFS